MGGVNSSYNDKINWQETVINSYYNSNKCDLSCSGKYSKRQIKGKLREYYHNSNYSHSNDYILSYDAKYKSNDSYACAPTYSNYR
jgi:hypothetical protein